MQNIGIRVDLASTATAEKARPSLSAFFSLAFRPFFLLALAAALALVPAWVAVLRGWLPISTAYYGPLLWHGHEMLYGFVTAAVAGFLLTASANWTGVRTVHGWPLAAIATLWLAGRAVAFAEGILPRPIIAAFDLAFYPALIASYLHPILTAKNWRNLVFLPPLLALAGGNLIVHLALNGIAVDPYIGLRLGQYAVIYLLVAIAGRVVPFFTRAVIADARTHVQPSVERILLPLTAAAGLAAALGSGPTWLLTGLYFACAAAHAGRSFAWFDRRIARHALLWILHLGYVFISVGFALLGLARLFALPQTAATHALTAGAMTLFIVGMLARVSLGHSGRRIIPPRNTVLAFYLLTVTLALRLAYAFTPALDLLLIGAATAWFAAFALLARSYVPILLAPRLDGRP